MTIQEVWLCQEYPVWFMLVVGAVELGSAILVLIPPVAFAGASLIAIDMIGGLATTLRFGQDDRALLSLILLVISLVVAFARWPGFRGRSSLLRTRSLSTRSLSTRSLSI
jgi:hypothetical protein